MLEKYLVIDRNKSAGFFSNFFWALNASITAKELDLIPILELPLSSRASRQGHERNRPSWSRYFVVLDSFNSSSIPENQKTTFGEKKQNAQVRNLTELRLMFWQVMPFRPEIRKRLDQEILEIGFNQHKRILGVHFRGKDMYWHPSHPTPPTQNQMIDLVLQLLNQDDFEGIFVATDTISFIARLRERLSLPVMHFSAEKDNPHAPIDDSYSVYPVIRDAWALSKCSVLLHSDSNVSSAARLFRAADYEERLEINLGSNPRSLFISLARHFWRSVIPDKFRRENLKVEIVKGNQN